MVIEKSLTLIIYDMGSIIRFQYKRQIISVLFALLFMQGAAQESEKNQIERWSGSCFAIGERLVATNYHVVENARTLVITGIPGDISKEYSAEVILTDKSNDLAVMKVTDNAFNGFNIKYGVKNSVVDIGTSIFVLGYPLTMTMGEDIKLTTGVISSKTGFQGDVSQYQISAAIQPGNSGGPLFDDQGDLIGIVSAKHRGAENVGYAIKVSYLRNLLESSNNAISMNMMTNTISSLSLPEKIKAIIPCVLLVKASSSASPNSSIDHYKKEGFSQESRENTIKANSLLESAKEKYRNQDFEGAYKDVCQSVNLFPTPDGHFTKAFIATIIRKDVDNAILSMDYCLQNDYNTEDCYTILYICYLQKDDWEKAILYADKALEFDRKNMNALEIRGKAKSNLGKKDEAIADYLQAIKFEGVVEYNYANIYNNLASEYLNQDELNKAQEYIAKSLRQSHLFGNAWCTNGELNFRLGNYNDCIKCMNNSITIFKLMNNVEWIGNSWIGNSWIGNSFLYRGLAKKCVGDITGAYNDIQNAVKHGNETASIELNKIDTSSIDFKDDRRTYNEMIANPYIKKKSSNELMIKGVEISNEFTAIHCQINNIQYKYGCTFSPEAYIQIRSSGEKCYLLGSENIGIYPQVTILNYGEERKFTLYFEAIPKDVKEIDFIEAPNIKDWNGWKVTGIKLQQ